MQKPIRAILRQLRYAFPPRKYSVVQEGAYLVVEKPFEEHSNVWLRLRKPCSFYGTDTTAELLSIIKGVFADEILWVIGYKKGEWQETTLLNNLAQLDTEPGVTYTIFSWSGSLDTVVEG